MISIVLDDGFMQFFPDVLAKIKWGGFAYDDDFLLQKKYARVIDRHWAYFIILKSIS